MMCRAGARADALSRLLRCERIRRSTQRAVQYPFESQRVGAAAAIHASPRRPSA